MKDNFVHLTIYQMVYEFSNCLRFIIRAVKSHYKYQLLVYRAAQRKHIKWKFVSISIISVLCSSTFMSCASVLTHLSPLESELVTETSFKSSSSSGVHYTCELGKNRIYLTRFPGCPTYAKTYRVAKKRSEVAIPIALGELALFGFGLADMIAMSVISEDSKVTYLLGDYETGLSMPCGKGEIASGETMIIENETHCIYHEVRTDNSGRIDLEPILGTIPNKLKYRISLKSDPTVSYSFIY